MRIYRPADPMDVEHPVILVGALHGLGKTTLGTTFNTLSFDFEQGGAARAARFSDIAAITSWADVDIRPERFRGRRGVTFDTVEGCLELLSADIKRQAKFRQGNGELNHQGWGELRRRFARFVATLRSYGLDVLFLTHLRTVREGDRVRLVPRIQGSSYHEVMRHAHVVGLLEIRDGRRVIDFSVSERWPGKNPGQWPVVEVPPVDEVGAFMQGMFDQARAVLGRAQVAGALTRGAVDAWRTVIATYQTTEDFARGLAKLRAVKDEDPTTYAQAFHLFKAAARAAGMKYDNGAFRYVGRPTPVAAPAVAPTPTVQARIEFAQQARAPRKVA